MQGVSKRVVQWYSICDSKASVTKTFILEDLQTIHRSTPLSLHMNAYCGFFWMEERGCGVTEQVGTAVAVWICESEVSGSNLGLYNSNSASFRTFPLFQMRPSSSFTCHTISG
jgi:hypothetical protein